jgi:Protein of unknown function (DUF1573)
MVRSLVVCLLLLPTLFSTAHAQQWAADMFPVKTYAFGSVARGAKAEHLFEFQNMYKEDVHIASVRASCGCTTPTILKDTLKSWEKGAIKAKFNTDLFLGQRGATITVVIDKPYYAEVQLRVDGFIRSDVVFDPGVVNIGQVEQGVGGEAKVKVLYAGRQNWSIVDVQSANSNFEVELSDAVRSQNLVNYTMTVRLKSDTPPGFVNDQLTLVTDDVSNKMIPINVEGRVVSALEVSPASVLVGNLEPGQSVTKQLVVRSKNAFSIKDIKCEHDCFDFKMPPDGEAKNLHLIPMTFTASDTPGQFNVKIRIETDKGFSCECSATGSIKPAEITDGPKPTPPVETSTAKLP